MTEKERGHKFFYSKDNKFVVKLFHSEEVSMTDDMFTNFYKFVVKLFHSEEVSMTDDMFTNFWDGCSVCIEFRIRILS